LKGCETAIEGEGPQAELWLIAIASEAPATTNTTNNPSSVLESMDMTGSLKLPRT
jgi:hypothetical protein